MSLNNLDPQQQADLVRTSPYFDEAWYRQEYPEIEYHSDGNPDPAFHYANYGYKEQRLPSLLFNGNKYSKYHNLRDVNPLLHYEHFGRQGSFRAKERLAEVLVKVSLGLDLNYCERVLYLEQAYQDRFLKGLDLLAHPPVTLSEKLYYILAFSKVNDASNLQQYDLMPSFLQERYGFNQENLPKVLASYDDVKDLNFETLPERFRVKCNGIYARAIYVKHKSHITKDDFLPLLQNLQRESKALALLNPLAFDQNINNKIVICEHQEKAFDEVSDESYSEYRPSELTIFCCNGQVAFFAVYGPSHAITFFDQEFNLMPTTITTDSSGAHPIVLNVAKPSYLDKMKEVAIKLSQDYTMTRVSFVLYENDFVFDEINIMPHHLNFKVSNDFDLKLGTLLNINHIKAQA